MMIEFIKKKCFLIITLLLISVVYSQGSSDTVKSEIIIYFKDGTTISGQTFKFVTNTLNHNGYVYFDDDKEVKKKKYEVGLIDYILLKYESIDDDGLKKNVVNRFVFKKINGKFKQLIVVLDGKIQLYFFESWATNGNYVHKEFYVQRKNESRMTLLSKVRMSNKKFIKNSTNYFSDCPELILKINNKEYTYKNIINIIKFYNEHCN